MWITALCIREKDDPAKFKQVIEACNFCVVKDKAQNFRYEVEQESEAIYIYSSNKSQSFKRGMYFYKKFGVNFNVYFEKQNQKTI